MNIIEGLKEIDEELFSNQIMLRDIQPSIGQQYVLDLNTDERVTVFNNFRGRRTGQSWAVILKAIQLSNEGNKNIAIYSDFAGNNEYICTSFFHILELCNQSHKVIKQTGDRFNKKIKLTNGSNITFAMTSGTSMRGVSSDYALCDNVSLSNQELLDSLVHSVIREDGQVFLFPNIHDRRSY